MKKEQLANYFKEQEEKPSRFLSGNEIFENAENEANNVQKASDVKIEQFTAQIHEARKINVDIMGVLDGFEPSRNKKIG